MQIVNLLKIAMKLRLVLFQQTGQKFALQLGGLFMQAVEHFDLMPIHEAREIVRYAHTAEIDALMTCVYGRCLLRCLRSLFG